LGALGETGSDAGRELRWKGCTSCMEGSGAGRKRDSSSACGGLRMTEDKAFRAFRSFRSFGAGETVGDVGSDLHTSQIRKLGLSAMQECQCGVAYGKITERITRKQF